MRNRTKKPKVNRYKRPGSLAQLTQVLWAALLEIEAVTRDGDKDRKLKAGHTLATLAGSYVKTLEASNLALQMQVVQNDVKQSQMEWVQFRVLILEGLGPYPEAKAHLMKVLNAHTA